MSFAVRQLILFYIGLSLSLQAFALPLRMRGHIFVQDSTPRSAQIVTKVGSVVHIPVASFTDANFLLLKELNNTKAEASLSNDQIEKLEFDYESRNTQTSLILSPDSVEFAGKIHTNGRDHYVLIQTREGSKPIYLRGILMESPETEEFCSAPSALLEGRLRADGRSIDVIKIQKTDGDPSRWTNVTGFMTSGPHWLTGLKSYFIEGINKEKIWLDMAVDAKHDAMEGEQVFVRGHDDHGFINVTEIRMQKPQDLSCADSLWSEFQSQTEKKRLSKDAQ